VVVEDNAMEPIDSVAALLKELNKLKHTKDASYYFRGEAQDFDKTACVPSLYRKIEWLQNERYYYNESFRRYPNVFKKSQKSIERLTLLAHYGFPTRLLDVTKNPLVALYFATLETNETQGKFFCIRVPRNKIHYRGNEDVEKIAKSPRLNDDALKNENIQPSVLFVKSPWLFERLRAQEGAMLLFGGSRDSIDAHGTIKYDPCEDDLCIAKTFDIKKTEQLKKELKLLCMTKRNLFPDLDHFSEDLKGSL
jgi:hypothetical protein